MSIRHAGPCVLGERRKLPGPQGGWERGDRGLRLFRVLLDAFEDVTLPCGDRDGVRVSSSEY